MKRTVFLISTLALVLAAPAAAKGPDQATITGPGLEGDNQIVFGSKGDPAAGTPFGVLVENTGFFPGVFGQSPSPMLAGRPDGDLGPRYVIAYRVPGPNNELDAIRQDLYPYAAGGPVTYMKPGQPVFGNETLGGWYRATESFKQTLVSMGLPKSAPGTSGGGSSFEPTANWLAIALVVLLAGAMLVAVRRRPRTAAH